MSAEVVYLTLAILLAVTFIGVSGLAIGVFVGRTKS